MGRSLPADKRPQPGRAGGGGRTLDDLLQLAPACADTWSYESASCSKELQEGWGQRGASRKSAFRTTIAGGLRRAKALLGSASPLFLVALAGALEGIAGAWLVVFSMAMTGTALVFFLRRNRQTFK
jgi:hypothetical protein